MLKITFMLNPLTGAVCPQPQLRAMVDEMLQAQQRWLPQFKTHA